MNNIFKIIWNKTTQRIEVVSELAKGAVKASSGSHQFKSIAIKSTLKLSLLSLCLGFTNEAMALANIDGKTTFHAPQGGVLKQNGNGKYAVGVYDKESGSFAFGYAQAGHKDPTPNEPEAVGNKQLAIGNDNLTSSGHSSIAIGSNVGDNLAPNDGTKFRKGGAQGMYTVAIGAGMQAIGRNVVAIGRESGNGGAYNGYDDAVYLGSYSRINPKGQGQADNINTSALENTYTTAVTNYNGQNNETNLNAIINAGRAINNVALNKVDKMTIKYNVNENSQLNTKEQDIEPVNASKDKTTVSILSIGGKNGDNKMYRQIQNVAAGRMSADSFDAVNGSQLYYVRNYTGWNIGHNSDNKDTVTGRVNNDHTVIFKAKDNYINVSTTLDSTNKSTVNIGVNTSDISVTANDGRITAVTPANPANTVATTTSVKEALETFDKVKADKVDIMGYSHVNSNGNTRDQALLKADGTKATFNYEGRNNSSITNASGGETKNNNGKYAEASGAQADRSIASGVYANALAKDSIAIGTGANVNNYWGKQFNESLNGIAIGKLAQVEGSAGAIAFGAGSTILRNEPYNVGSANAIAIGNDSKITAASGAIAIGNKTNITGINTGVGNGAVNAIAIGNGATVERENSIAIGAQAIAKNSRSIVIGGQGDELGPNDIKDNGENNNTKHYATANKENSIVIGNGARSLDSGSYTIVMGGNAQARASASIVMGDRAASEKNATGAVTIGQNARSANAGDVVLGRNSKTEDRTLDAKYYDGNSGIQNKLSDDLKIGETNIGNKGTKGSNQGVVSVGSSSLKRQIQNVGAGLISETSTDAINGSQLYHVIKAADEIAKTEYKFTVGGSDVRVMGNKGLSTKNNESNTLNFAAADGLDVEGANGTVTYKLNADSKKAITDAKTAATTVTNKLNEINKSVKRAETAAQTATDKAAEATAAAGKAKESEAAAATSAKTASDKAGEAAGSAQTATDKAAEATAAAGKAKESEAAAATSAKTASDKAGEAAGSAQTATDKAAEATAAAGKAKESEAAAATSAKTASDKAGEAAGSAQTATDKAAEATAAAGKAKESEDNVKIIGKRIENSGLISKDGKTAFAADNTSGRNSAKASGKDSTAMGYGSEANGDHSTALGNNAKANAVRSTAIGHNADAKASGSVALGEGSIAKEENTVSVGNIGHERRITNVQDPKNLTDAANKRYVDNSISSVRSELKQTDKKLRGGIAGAVAMANIPTANRAGGTMVGIGVGSFKGQSAVAVGVNRASDSNRVHFKMSGSATTSGDYAVGAGMGYQW
ncbi:YadA-like family protein [Haemophilus haemolyticus]|uniref:YadA-like family protein n=1 Tax=Haemophilus haemolyticus TaxID=726 RepID=UPI0010648AC3|nr:YadA-like family protein [Haemophilus haemolyticus]